MAKKQEKKLELINMSVIDLQKLMSDLKKENQEMRFNKVLGTNFNLLSFKTNKKKIAQVMTIMNLKKMEGANGE